MVVGKWSAERRMVISREERIDKRERTGWPSKTRTGCVYYGAYEQIEHSGGTRLKLVSSLFEMW